MIAISPEYHLLAGIFLPTWTGLDNIFLHLSFDICCVQYFSRVGGTPRVVLQLGR